MADQSIYSRIAERLHDVKADLVPRVAALRRPVYGNVPVSKQERRRRWWQEAPGWTPERELELLGQGMSREDVGLLKFPAREIDARVAGNGDDDRRMARYAREMTDLGPPEPEHPTLADDTRRWPTLADDTRRWPTLADDAGQVPPEPVPPTPGGPS